VAAVADRRPRKVVVCFEWLSMHPSRDPRFWHEVGTERHRRRIRKHDYVRLRVIIQQVAKRRFGNA
jgi:hypothetical protein